MSQPPRTLDAPLPATDRRPDYRLDKILASFGYAFRGVWYLLRTQRNAQIHCLAALCATALGLWLGLERWEWLAITITIGMVIAAEGFNTAIEAAVDTATSEYHPMAAVAKDVGAGAVLICAITAVVVGCIVFLPHLWALLSGWLGWGG